MSYKLYFGEHRNCQICTERTERDFKYIETKKNEKHVFEMENTFTIAFILSGEALVSCNEFVNVIFRTDDIVLWPMNSNCSWESLTDTSAIVLTSDNDLMRCDSESLKKYAASWLNSVPEFKGLQIKPRLKEFLYTVKNYLDDGITCHYMHRVKQRELSIIFKAYYSAQELMNFFFPAVRNTYEFEMFIHDNYLKMKGVKEFVDLSGMSLVKFNRKFKSLFKESPYQWLIKQKSKHIYYDLTSTDKSFIAIAKEYHFTDASHFNRYCKAIFGNSPSKIREDAYAEKERKLAKINY